MYSTSTRHVLKEGPDCVTAAVAVALCGDMYLRTAVVANLIYVRVVFCTVYDMKWDRQRGDEVFMNHGRTCVFFSICFSELTQWEGMIHYVHVYIHTCNWVG